ncbi:MAG: hypothetical protein RL757_384 [Bacteroidota bacterium]|jgi:YD repeat-containing protein
MSDKRVILSKKIFTIHCSFFAFLLLAWGCGGNVSPSGYRAYMSDPKNGLTQETNGAGFVWTCTYEPLDYVVARETRQTPTEKTLTDYLGMQYFMLELSDTGGGGIKQAIRRKVGETELSKTADYFNFGMQSGIKLVASGDTMSCLKYHFEQSGGVGNKLRFMLGFNDPKRQQKPNMQTDFTLVFDNQLLGSDSIRFVFRKDDMNRSPNIKL